MRRIRPLSCLEPYVSSRGRPDAQPVAQGDVPQADRPLRRMLAAMEIRPALFHVAVAVIVGGAIAFFSPARWLAASLWVSAAMLVNGAIATAEDAQPDCVDANSGWGALAARCAFAALAVGSLGFAAQFLLPSAP